MYVVYFIYIYICVCVCVCVCVYVCICIYHLCIYIYIYIHYMCLCRYVCVCVVSLMYLRHIYILCYVMLTIESASMYVYIYVYTYVHTYTHAYIRILLITATKSWSLIDSCSHAISCTHNVCDHYNESLLSPLWETLQWSRDAVSCNFLNGKIIIFCRLAHISISYKSKFI